jgi:mannose-6-phosphate isomerase-like protein (cupin superfamily)
MNRDYEKFYQERRFSQITEEFPDEKIFPLFYKALKREFILEEGESLTIPALWPHITISELDDINVSYNFFFGKDDKCTPCVTDNSYSFDIEKMLKNEEKIEVKKTKTNSFHSNLSEHRFDDIKTILHMSFKEFYDAKYKRLCINKKMVFDDVPLYKTDLIESAIRINFGNNMYTQLHFDNADSMICQVKSRKRVIIFHPSERYNLYFFNSYDLELIEKINHSFIADKYVVIMNNAIPQHVCLNLSNSVKAEKVKKIRTPELTELFKQYRNEYKHKMITEGAWFDYSNDLPISFVIQDTREENETVLDSIDSSVTVIFILNKGQFRVNKHIYNLNAGDVISFPSSVTHPWMSMNNTVIIYPNFNKD